MREDAVTRAHAVARTRACALALVIANASACTAKSIPAGGLVIAMSLDPSLPVAELSNLHVGIRSPGDGGKVYRNLTYPVAPKGGSGDAGAGVSFPATLTIESNGDPSASVVVNLDLWEGSKPVDVREYQVVDLPTDRFVELVVVFGAACGSKAALVDGQAVSLCIAGLTCQLCNPGPTCDSSSNGTCTNNVLPASSLPAYSEDAGASLPLPLPEAGPDDATLDDASPVDSAGGKAPGVDAAADGETSDAGEPDGFVAIGVPPPVPCESPCTEGVTHCIGGTCIPVPPSCAGHDPGVGFNCGGAFGSNDCCAWFDVGGGSFYRDYDTVSNDNTSAPATVSPFGLDVYEVTVGRFRKFVAAVVGGDAALPWTPAVGAGKHAELNDEAGLVNGGGGAPVYEQGWEPSWNAFLPTTRAGWNASLDCFDDAEPPTNTWTPAQTPAVENLPIDCVNWYQAYAFCIWDGGFLPSATEWNRAAAPPDPMTGQRIYAWGSNPPLPDCKLAIWGSYYGGGSFSSKGVPMGLLNIGPVGTASNGAGLWGQLDLTGNVWEWTLDYWTGVLLDPCVDCADTAAGTQRIARGGAFDNGDLTDLANSYSVHSPPEMVHGDVGFRCARAP